ncbi:hypothetical protein GCM10007420_26390 [Glycocaulis albus]|uniref:Uncharacterized protein n=1 Tax=Glycocaulis albus TaxID=1382801 RepID=A0ABQ1Y060_9PROT|nr:accessory factor UbiK family protein [Glycocaulis albus]GGH08241.1 hypothetical protein GCM10007420_26390 [Glycocaulis albus]
MAYRLQSGINGEICGADIALDGPEGLYPDLYTSKDRLVMQTRNPVFTDLADLMTDAFGAARAAGDEARSVFRAQAERVAADMDLASGEEVRALQAIIARQGEEIESLKARLTALEGKKPAPSRAAAASKRKPASKKASS